MSNWANKGFTFKPCPGCGHSSFVVEESYCGCADDSESDCRCRYSWTPPSPKPDERFCADTGLYFTREEDGAVRIDISQPGEHDIHLRIVQATWASILAHVALDATFAEAEKLHGFMLRVG